MSKTLSTGTLSLRFMQNALRRQKNEPVELERAEVKDEGKWEVRQDIKKAWGTTQETPHNDSVEYEPSYLPFLFSSDHEDTASHAPKPLGRRMFDKKGQDVSQSQPQSQTQQTAEGIEGDSSLDKSDSTTDIDDDATPSMQASKHDEPLTKGRKFKVHAKPRSISSAFGRDLKGFDALDRSNKDGRRLSTGIGQKSAREAIFNSLNGVGTDLRPTKNAPEDRHASGLEGTPGTHRPELKQQKQKQKQQQKSTNVAPIGFLKPSGVDEPAPQKIVPDTVTGKKPSKSPLPKILDGARKKRPWDSGDGPGDEDRKKTKQKQSMSSKGTMG